MFRRKTTFICLIQESPEKVSKNFFGRQLDDSENTFLFIRKKLGLKDLRKLHAYMTSPARLEIALFSMTVENSFRTPFALMLHHRMISVFRLIYCWGKNTCFSRLPHTRFLQNFFIQSTFWLWFYTRPKLPVSFERKALPRIPFAPLQSFFITMIHLSSRVIDLYKTYSPYSSEFCFFFFLLLFQIVSASSAMYFEPIWNGISLHVHAADAPTQVLFPCWLKNYHTAPQFTSTNQQINM